MCNVRRAWDLTEVPFADPTQRSPLLVARHLIQTIFFTLPMQQNNSNEKLQRLLKGMQQLHNEVVSSLRDWASSPGTLDPAKLHSHPACDRIPLLDLPGFDAPCQEMLRVLRLMSVFKIAHFAGRAGGQSRDHHAHEGAVRAAWGGGRRLLFYGASSSLSPSLQFKVALCDPMDLDGILNEDFRRALPACWKRRTESRKSGMPCTQGARSKLLSCSSVQSVLRVAACLAFGTAAHGLVF